ncbi:NAD(P)/FAD-dependent oxidoreductase [Rubripirellula obstinata]|uniref:NAD(P)/FAD-dependent oxidoreductase n=1 Tax=Rubripirellula obstinata TaxID=406547 RepID=UPI0008369420|nr:NAD(P)/FAD-dependent oxidoreductase [Rubripirellula obstinata]
MKSPNTSSVNQRKHIIVIGAGAAGMIAAGEAARRGARVTLLEKNNKTGVKILMSGGTRCNITHDTDARGITEVFGHARRFLQPSVGRFSPTDVVQMFNKLGVATKIESTGKVFPESNRAVEVRDALHQDMIQAGVDLRLNCGVTDLRIAESGSGETNHWEVVTETETLACDVVIVTAGGQSWPGCGTTGDAYAWLRKLGHKIVQTRPALVPLVGGTDWMRALSGITLDDCVATVRTKTNTGEIQTGKKAVLIQRRSSLLLTHFGLSGPAAMDVSGSMTAASRIDQVHLEVDVLPNESEAEVENWFTNRSGNDGRRRVSSIVAGVMPQRLADSIVAASDSDCHVSDLPAKNRRRLVSCLKRLPVPITGTRGFAKAEVTAGGVKLAEVNPSTMESRLQKNLYIAGEVLDVDGWIGGYNFQAAFSTGHAAAVAATSE